MAIDNDEKMEHMCPKCRDEVVSDNSCTRCGKAINDGAESFVNPNFDRARYDKLSRE